MSTAGKQFDKEIRAALQSRTHLVTENRRLRRRVEGLEKFWEPIVEAVDNQTRQLQHLEELIVDMSRRRNQ